MYSLLLDGFYERVWNQKGNVFGCLFQKRRKEKVKIKGISYQSNYYLDNIKDKKLLKRIAESGLEEKLKNVVIQQVKKSGFAKRNGKKSAKAEFQVDLLDDESLPVQWWIT